MKKIISVILCAGAILLATTLFAVQSKETETNEREVTGDTQQQLIRLTRYDGQHITGVEASSGFDIYLIQSHETKVVAEINEELEDRLELSLSPDGIVRVRLSSVGQSGRNGRSGDNRNSLRNLNRLNSRNSILKVTVYLPELTYLKASGAVTVQSTGVFNSSAAEIILSGASDVKSLNLNTAGRLKIQCSGASDGSILGKAGTAEIQVSGASDVTLNLICDNITLSCAGASDLTITGEADSGTMTVSGGSDFSASGFAVKRLDVTASGASDARVWAVDELRAKATSASDLKYKGNPPVFETSSSSAGSVKRMN